MIFFAKRSLAALATLTIAGTAQAADDVMVVFDGSNSMWGQIDGTAKIEIARDVIGNLVDEIEDGTNVGLMAYGHRRRGDCTDIEVMQEPGPLDRDAFLGRIAEITPTGKTPLTDAVEQAAERLAFRDRPATVVLISDGVESCERDPCALADELERAGVGFTAHVVGFGLGANEDTASLSCIADRTGGKFLTAGNADELGAALSAVGAEVAQAPEPEPEPEPEPQVTLTGPATVTQGARFDVSWDPVAEDPRDFVTIVPMDAEDDARRDHLRVGDETTGQLRAPGETGLYELRYVLDETGEVAGRASIEVGPADVTISGPDAVLTGANFEVSWTGAVHPRDFVTIVPMGADPDETRDYRRVGDASTGTLTAPAETGLYELRYVLDEGRKVLATAPVEVTTPEVTVSGPESALTGARFEVQWSGAVHPRDYVTIAPMGSDDEATGDYFRVGKASSNTLVAPADTGLYELRYVLQEGKDVLARAPIEITEPEVTVSGPERTLTGAPFEVQWSGTVHPRDYVTIVPMGADDDASGDYKRVGNATSNTLVAPSDTGLYELRYVLQEGKEVLARATIEVAAPEVTVSGPDSTAIGAQFEVQWSGTVHPRDYVTIVPMGADNDASGDYKRVGNATSATLVAPAETGLYELRYVLQEGKKVLASAPIEVTEPEVGLTGPDQLRVGDQIKAGISGIVHPRDYVTIVPAGSADDSSGDYKRVGNATEITLTAPESPGLYELRYVLQQGKKVMARHNVEVLGKDAQLSSGAQLTVPETAAPGSEIEVSWQVDGDSADRRITVAGADQAIFTWITARKIDGPPPLTIKMPEEPGLYEVRFLDVSNQKVLSRAPIRVE